MRSGSVHSASTCAVRSRHSLQFQNGIAAPREERSGELLRIFSYGKRFPQTKLCTLPKPD
jgi:hypothetical protein